MNAKQYAEAIFRSAALSVQIKKDPKNCEARKELRQLKAAMSEYEQRKSGNAARVIEAFVRG